MRATASQPKSQKTSMPLVVGAVVVGVALLFGLRGLREARLRSARIAGNEAAAVGAMMVTTTAQALFREGDKDRDEVFDYAASLRELSDAGLIDRILGSGEKQGYAFDLHRPADGTDGAEFLWMLTAQPVKPGISGNRCFATNQSGEIVELQQPAVPSDSCVLPEGVSATRPF